MKKTLSQNELEEIKFDKDGLVPVVVQDSKTGEVKYLKKNLMIKIIIFLSEF